MKRENRALFARRYALRRTKRKWVKRLDLNAAALDSVEE